MSNIVEQKSSAPPAIQSYGEIIRMAEAVCGSAMIPDAFKGKPQDVAVAMMMAHEQGAPLITSLGSIAVINGKACWHSDAIPGIAMSRGMISHLKESIEGEGENMVAHCSCKRPDGSEVSQSFSVGDAKAASLWNKTGPWKQYPKRMLQMRARSWCIRDAAPHAFFGPTKEEMEGVQQHVGPDKAKDVTPTPAARPTSKAGKKTAPPADMGQDPLAGIEDDLVVFDAWLGRDEIEQHSDIKSATKSIVRAMKAAPVPERAAFISNNVWIYLLEPKTQDYISNIATGVGN